MTVKFTIGRRIPRNYFRRKIQKLSNILSFQEHLWYIINNSLKLAKRKANSANKNLIFIIERDTENEDLYYKIQWVTVSIKGTKEEEEEEYKDCLKFYDPLGKLFDKEKSITGNLSTKLTTMFKSKLVPISKIEEMYKKGLDETNANNIANKLLEVGIMSNVEWIHDF